VSRLSLKWSCPSTGANDDGRRFPSKPRKLTEEDPRAPAFSHYETYVRIVVDGPAAP
jgi:hypothetical protein